MPAGGRHQMRSGAAGAGAARDGAVRRSGQERQLRRGAGGEMVEDAVDDLWVFYARDDAGRAAAVMAWTPLLCTASRCAKVEVLVNHLTR
jgi:hypothetical protein